MVWNTRSTQAYIEGAKDLRVWAAYQESDVVGFISLSYSSEDCAEIDCLGVKKSFRRLKGINTTIEREAVKTSGLPYRSKQSQKVQIKIMTEQMSFIAVLVLKNTRFFPQLWDPESMSDSD